MYTNKKIYFIILSLVFSLVIVTHSENIGLSSTNTIYIDGNANFTATASSHLWPGNGSIDDPIIIDGLDLHGSEEMLFTLKNTDLFLKIQHSVFNNSMYGIFLENVSHAEISDNVFSSNQWGVYQEVSANNSFISNSFISNTIGIYNLNSYDVIIESNDFHKDYWSIHHHRSGDSIIQENVFTGASTALHMERAREGNYVTNNEIENSDEGIRLTLSGDGNDIVNNNIFDNNYGIIGSSTAFANISNNDIYDNNNGIFLTGGSGNNITENIVHRNVIGIHVDRQSGSYASIISGNSAFENTECGIKLSFGTNTFAYNNEMYMNQRGLQLSYGVQNSAYNNNIHDNQYGIYLDSADNPRIYGHDLVNNGFFITHYVNSLLYHRIHDLDNNTVNGLEIAYYNHTTGNLVDREYGQIILINVSSAVISDYTIAKASIGIFLSHCSDIELSNNMLLFNTEGIGIYHSSQISVVSNSLNYGGQGVAVVSSDNITITDNEINSNFEGVYLDESDDILVSNNTIQSSFYDGVYATSGSDVVISNNFIHSNGRFIPEAILNTNLALDYDFYDPYDKNNGFSSFYVSNLLIQENTFYNNSGYGSYVEGACQLANNDYIHNGFYNQTLALPQILCNDNSSITNNYFHDLSYLNTECSDGDDNGICDEAYEFKSSYNTSLTTYSITKPNGNHHFLGEPEITQVLFNRDEFGVFAIDFTWEDALDTTSHDVKYTLFFSDSAGNNIIRYNDTQESSVRILVGGLTTGTYTFTVVAQCEVGSVSATSVEVEVDNQDRPVTTSTPPTTSSVVTSTPTTSTPNTEDINVDGDETSDAPLIVNSFIILLITSFVIRRRNSIINDQ
ncbi:MAG: right-handed parallel beta-helix repeat-containing protein [Candidatus Heimdallarchaeota archaeon]|nr:right-handed parallel beta-helix repeat-containing protein [Candidatus Heimdallarchaeota archaeon]